MLTNGLRVVVCSEVCVDETVDSSIVEGSVSSFNHLKE